MMAVSIFTITMMTFAIAGLALGFGALFRNSTPRTRRRFRLHSEDWC